MTTVAGILATTVLTGTNAQAASGGGCAGYSSGVIRERFIEMRVCISAPSHGVGRPDGFLTLRSGHPACKVFIRAVRTGGSRVVSNKVHTCPSGAFRMKRFAAPDFNDSHHEEGEGYATYMQVQWSDGSWAPPYPYRSPWLKLP
ncbi:hypothetical protein ACH4U5_00700 [Streptomyces sp. NPDC020858]|uniref:hypothetical protein n=1 Tax=Streptomyces sp. NPDC020858 TaxID=3365097 RepID=UPI00378F1B5C